MARTREDFEVVSQIPHRKTSKTQLQLLHPRTRLQWIKVDHLFSTQLLNFYFVCSVNELTHGEPGLFFGFPGDFR